MPPEGRDFGLVAAGAPDTTGPTWTEGEARGVLPLGRAPPDDSTSVAMGVRVLLGALFVSFGGLAGTTGVAGGDSSDASSWMETRDDEGASRVNLFEGAT
jgi:hypothetical protein